MTVIRKCCGLLRDRAWMWTSGLVTLVFAKSGTRSCSWCSEMYSQREQHAHKHHHIHTYNTAHRKQLEEHLQELQVHLSKWQGIGDRLVRRLLEEKKMVFGCYYTVKWGNKVGQSEGGGRDRTGTHRKGGGGGAEGATGEREIDRYSQQERHAHTRHYTQTQTRTSRVGVCCIRCSRRRSIQRSRVCIYGSLSMCSMKGKHGKEGGGGGTETEEVAKKQEGVGS